MKIAAFGEVMLRLTPPEFLLLEQTHSLRLDYTGTGVNIMGNLAHFGLDSYLVTTLPDNRIGDAAKANLRQLGIHDTFIQQNHQHMGTYFAEMGYGMRPTQVTYQNRHSSSFGQSDETGYDFSQLLETVDMVHICGISLSLTDETRRAAQALAKQAHQQGVKVCFDFNFRPSLNTEENKLQLMKEQYQQILPCCDLVFGSLRDLTDLLGLTVKEALPKEEQEKELIQRFMRMFELEWFAGTKRKQVGAVKELTGILYTQNQVVESMPKTITILDRIGTGDAYAAGLLLGYCEAWPLSETVEFATVNAAVSHTIQGDVPLTTREQIQQIMNDPTIDLIR
ncbi:carbohydrate kinase [Enterococcus sp. JM4C]|uniref:sugar kinase n=1 Tax=Candidatus Enterococcus huntleyi TaxID=1857217 RepID=UPI0013797C1C|nr:sugar kinase [Enterococcus sp. JM4C]KAF1299489.1 carbohydrate kinase [Enterococcus sp. JM4C]